MHAKKLESSQFHSQIQSSKSILYVNVSYLRTLQFKFKHFYCLFRALDKGLERKSLEEKIKPFTRKHQLVNKKILEARILLQRAALSSVESNHVIKKVSLSLRILENLMSDTLLSLLFFFLVV